MRRSGSLALATCLLGGLALSGLATAPRLAAQEPSLELKVATTVEKIKPFGRARSASQGEKVTIRFLRNDVEVDRKRVRIRADLSYIASFPRPADGTCTFKARYRSKRETITAERSIPCYRPTFERGEAVLTDVGTPPAGNETTTIEVEIADTNERRQYGLMYRKSLGANKGMAFLWADDTEGGFWMKNTLIPLSIAFFDRDGKIVSILDMEPCEKNECKTYDPGVRYRGALEVNQGRFDHWGIAVGDRIEISAP